MAQMIGFDTDRSEETRHRFFCSVNLNNFTYSETLKEKGNNNIDLKKKQNLKFKLL